MLPLVGENRENRDNEQARRVDVREAAGVDRRCRQARHQATQCAGLTTPCQARGIGSRAAGKAAAMKIDREFVLEHLREEGKNEKVQSRSK
jgi:hypothetical protein